MSSRTESRRQRKLTAKQRPKRRAEATRRPMIESLEDRRMMTATPSFAGGVLEITGSEQSDAIRVLNYGVGTIVYDNNVPVFALPSQIINSISIDARGGDDNVSVIRTPDYRFNPSTDFSSYYLFNLRPIPTTIRGGAGNDTLTGGVDQDTIWGGSGNDTIRGGGGGDILRGENGNDTLYGDSGNDTLNGGSGTDTLHGGSGKDTLDGGFGNDTLYGGSHDDTLRGSFGNDELHGEDGNDRLEGSFGDDLLFGGAGNDRLNGGFDDDVLRGESGSDRLDGGFDNDVLFGGDGHDTLYGGPGNDGLFGGRGVDSLDGGSGADRLLVWDAIFSDIAYHTTRNVESRDAVIRFTYGSDEWTSDEIERIDAALEILHQATDNTVLLKTSTGGQLIFQRNDGRGVGSNNGARISLTDLVMNGRRTWEIGYVLHEIGHHWETESPIYNNFLNLSGWTRSNPNSTAFRRIDRYSETWWYRTSTDFASDYAQTHPLEDFAESFAAYFLQLAGLPWYSGDGQGATAIPDKIALIDGWVNSL